MFDQLFTCRATIVRHRLAPLLDARVRFLQHCQEVGSPRGTLRRKARELLVISNQLDLQPDGAIRPEDVLVAARAWAYRQPSHYRAKDAEHVRAHFVLAAMRWLRFLGRLQAPPVPTYQAFIDAFGSYQERERGLSSTTIRSECDHVRQFLQRQWAAGRSLPDIAIRDLDEAIAQKGSQDGWCRVSVSIYATSLRAFFRYAEAQRWCLPGLADAILAPRVYRDAFTPSGPSWDVVQQLVRSTEGSCAVDIRDRAILMLLAVYGLRSEEVLRLQLEDLDWNRHRITIVRPKPRTIQQFPLATTVGEAILRYLTDVRRHRPSRHVFLTMRAPYGPMSRTALWRVVHNRLRPFHLSLRHQGPHALRHACATHLLAQGLSMKAIGDHLGHRHPDSTRVYAKVDLTRLREVADVDLGGLCHETR